MRAPRWVNLITIGQAITRIHLRGGLVKKDTEFYRCGGEAGDKDPLESVTPKCRASIRASVPAGAGISLQGLVAK